jgi:hypothetical protein
MLSIHQRQKELGLTNEIIVEESDAIPIGPVHQDTIRALWDKFGDQKFSRKDFSPSMIPAKALPNTCLLDVIKEKTTNTYQYRVFGTEMRDIVGVNLSGKTILDYPKRSCRTYLMRLHDECTHQAKPMHSVARIKYPRDITILTEKTLIPLFDEDQETVNMLLTVFTFDFCNQQKPGKDDVFTEPVSAHEQFRVFNSLNHLYIEANPTPRLHVL